MTFTIAQTKTTPRADFKNGYLIIRGKSVPFNHPEIYDIIHERLEEYSHNPGKTTRADFFLSAINAASKRCFINIFQLLERLSSQGIKVEVNWYFDYDNEDLLELGEFLQSSFNLPITLKEQVN